MGQGEEEGGAKELRRLEMGAEGRPREGSGRERAKKGRGGRGGGWSAAFLGEVLSSDPGPSYPAAAGREGARACGSSRSRGPSNPIQSPGAFWSQILWPRTGLDTLKGSRTVTCRCLPGRLGVDLPPWHPSLALKPGRKPPWKAEMSVMDCSPECVARPRGCLCLSSMLRWKPIFGSLATNRSPTVCRMEAKGWLFAFFSFGGSGRRQDSVRASLHSLVAGLRMPAP